MNCTYQHNSAINRIAASDITTLILPNLRCTGLLAGAKHCDSPAVSCLVAGDTIVLLVQSRPLIYKTPKHIRPVAGPALQFPMRLASSLESNQLRAGSPSYLCYTGERCLWL